VVDTVAEPVLAPATWGLRRLTTQVSTRPSVKVMRRATDSRLLPFIGSRSTFWITATPLFMGSMTLTNRSCSVPLGMRLRMMVEGRHRPLTQKSTGSPFTREGTGVLPMYTLAVPSSVIQSRVSRFEAEVSR
jgi:hypothetical protein